jgi:hypothetical protein
MRKGLVLLCFIGLLNAGSAAACDLVNKREIQVGTSEGIAGECSNNTATVQCISDGEGANRWNCDGPEGSFNGPNLQTLISTACGCGANPNDEAKEQLQQELGES